MSTLISIQDGIESLQDVEQRCGHQSLPRDLGSFVWYVDGVEEVVARNVRWERKLPMIFLPMRTMRTRTMIRR